MHSPATATPASLPAGSTEPASGQSVFERSPVFGTHAILSFGVAIIAPLLLFAAGAASLNRVLYPASVLMLASVLYAKRSPWFPGFCLWVFCVVSLVRRLTDYQAGFQPSSTILLAPYLATLPAMVSVPALIARRRDPCALPFLIIFLCIALGAVLAMVNERLVSGAVEALKWAVGPLMAAYVLVVRDQATHRVTLFALLVMAPLMSVYGALQFVNPSPWDAEWMHNVTLMGLDSIGRPSPFELRVFGIMHSPGSLAVYLMAAILVALSLPGPVAFPYIVVCSIGLGLAQYRTIWAATCMGLLVVSVLGSARDKLRIALAVVVLGFSVSGLALVPEIQYTLEKRFQSLNELSSDYSGEVRLQQYVDSMTNTPLIGEGFGLNGLSSRLDGQQPVIVDSGIIDALMALGLFGAVLFFGALAALLVAAFRPTRVVVPQLSLFRAVAVACFIQVPLGSIHTSEAGFIGWLFLGLALAAPRIPRSLPP